MSRRRIRRKAHPALVPVALMLAAGAGTLLPAPSVQAQETQVGGQAAKTYRIPAGSLDQVLNAFASEAGIELSVASALTQGKSSAGLSGRYGVDDAFAHVLAGQGLQAVRSPSGVYFLHALPGSAEGATLLAPVRVSGDARSHDGSVRSGYRSSEVSQVGPWQGRELEELPYSITVLPAALIDNLGGVSPDQLYRINPTMQFHRSQHENDQPTAYLRGFTGGGAVYRNGMPGGQYGQGTALEDTERVEVMSGLSGFLYGPGNVGGVINYVSKRPTAERLNRVTVNNSGGSNVRLQGDFGGPIDRQGRFGYRVNAAWQDGETAIEEMSIRSNFVSAAFDWNVTDRLLLQVDVADRDYRRDGAMAYWSLAAGASRPSARDIDPARVSAQPWMRARYENTRYGANLKWEAASWLTVRAAWHQDDGTEISPSASNVVQADGTYNQSLSRIYAPGSNEIFTDKEDTRGQLFADLRFDTGGVSHQLTAGVQYGENLQYRFRNGPPSLSTLTGVRLEDAPVYVERPAVAAIDPGERGLVIDLTNTTVTLGDDIRIDEQWSVLAGLSWSEIDAGRITAIFPAAAYRKSAVTPSLSLIYKPLPTVTTYATYLESLERGGTAAELFNNEPVVNRGQVMKPLVSDQIELGAKISLGEVLLATALFQIDKALQYYDITIPTAPVYVQDGRQVHRGVELTAFGRVAERWSVIGGFTLLDAAVREQKQNRALEGKRPTVVAEQLFKLRTEYDTPWLAGLTLVGGVNYTSGRYADNVNTDRLPSFTLLDAGARYALQVGGQPVVARLEVQNLGDKRYWANGSQVGDPRAVTFSLSAEF